MKASDGLRTAHQHIQSHLEHNDYALFVLEGQDGTDDLTYLDMMILVNENSDAERAMYAVLDSSGTFTIRNAGEPNE